MTLLRLFSLTITLAALLPEVTSYYHGGLVLDFLCHYREDPVYVRDVPWDCAAYVVCVRGRAVHSQCPGGKLYEHEGRGRRCQNASIVDTRRCRGKIVNYLAEICQANPEARVPSPDSCSQYFNCALTRQPATGSTQQATLDLWRKAQETGWISRSSGPTERLPLTEGLPALVKREAQYHTNALTGAEASGNGTELFMDHVLECPYPLLFSADSGLCADHKLVACRARFEPKAPCEYLQYLQLYPACLAPTCDLCVQHHPSCLTLPDGLHLVPGRPDLRMNCSGERTVDLHTCPPGYSIVDGSTECVKAPAV